MLQRLWHRVVGHSPIIKVTRVLPQPNAEMHSYPNLEMWNVARFGALTIAMVCPCGRACINMALIGKEEDPSAVDKEIADLRKMAGL